MSAPARLLALRLQGFKSFAERTLVEFGPGISAVVGPNGSGKSNLADALRWTLGEQGRSLRTRKSEDVIWAGSERRSALGMADVTLVLDNSDSLLPVDFSVLELGRRLFRSGENDYLLNRQRVRLRDLVDLLDAANLADNAFLFIGQGMVDQALALRPEERRPLFEEVAGVRRPERRRRKAEEQLAESEGNLARVEDILAELRPQARRLAAQAEQQATRATAGADLAEALVLAAHSRWHEAAGRLAETVTRRQRASGDADRAMAALEAAESAAGAIAAELGTRAAIEQERRAVHETARAILTDLQLREARLEGDLEAIERDRGRLRDERAAAESDLARHRGTVMGGVPRRDVDLEAALTEAERALAEALAELATLQAASRARGEELAAVRRAHAARQAEVETARRRAADAERRATEEHERRTRAEAARVEAEASSAAAATAREAAEAAESTARSETESARHALEAQEAVRREANDRLTSADTALADLRGRIASLDARLHEEETRGIARAARRLGGVRVDEDLVVEPAARPAVEAALGDTARAYLLDRGAVTDVAGERGVIVVRDAAAAGATLDAAGRRLLERAIELGGGPLTDSIRRDPTGSATAILARTVLLPDLGACLAIQAELPAGWRAVPRDGSAVVTSLAVALGRPDGLLERRAERTRLGAELERLEEARHDLAAAAHEATKAADAARQALETCRAVEATAIAARRRAEDAERLAVRNREAAVREAVWHAAQTERLDADVERLRVALAALDADAGEPGPSSRTPSSAGVPADVPQDAIETWKARIADLRVRRDRLAEEHAIREAARRDAEARHARAEAAIAMAEERITRADREAAALSDRRSVLEIERDALRAELTTAAEAEARARAELEQMRQADAADRSRLADAERAAASAREALRDADERLRAADHAELESRLGLEALREQVLVELAGLGPLGVAGLVHAGVAGAVPGPKPAMAGDMPAPDGDDVDDRSFAPRAGPVASDAAADPADEAAVLAAALDAVASAWAASPPSSEPPTPGRLAHLRRRYHELGAANPFAVEEYDEVRARLAALETQAADLRSAIASTRGLIDELNRMIAEQFATTFRALEAAFDRRFNQLFGGGYAKLSLTDPDDLSASGVDIVARPPGKKAQALAMLSGGERALTAVALLFAMLEVRPVPFCVLDEVDAALDEANVGRFSDALRSLADQTQFIVITHNRGTIEAADALYGVTVGDDSVSRVISLRLDEARAIADRRQEREPAATPVP